MSSLRSIRVVSLTLLSATALFGAGCSSGNEPVKLTPAQAAAANAKSAQASGTATGMPRPDAGANPHAGVTGGAAGGSAGGSAGKGGSALQFNVPEGWVVQIPSSSMRKAQFQLPKEASDPEDAQLVLYYFGGEGGTKEANLERWAGQFVQPDGRPSKDVLVTNHRIVNGMPVTEASITGTFDAEMMPGQGDRVRREKWSMLAAIIETQSGPYYAKLTGPSATVGRWEPSFRQWISSLKPSGS